MKILISLLSASGLAFTVSAAHRTIRAPKSNNDNLDEEFDEAKKNITAEYGKKFMESAVFDDYQALEKKIDSYKYLNDSTIFSTVEKMGNVASNVYLDYSYAIWKEAAKDTPVDLEYIGSTFEAPVGNKTVKGVTSAYLLSLDTVSGNPLTFSEDNDFYYRGKINDDCGIYFDTKNQKEVLQCAKNVNCDSHMKTLYADDLFHPCSSLNKKANRITQANMKKLSESFDKLYNQFKVEDWNNLNGYEASIIMNESLDVLNDFANQFMKTLSKWLVYLIIGLIVICCACGFCCYAICNNM